MIVVYGATGHTGRMVAAALLAADHRVILSGRNASALAGLAAELDGHVEVRPAALDDAAALRAAAAGAAVVINCAGPFARSGLQVASAAVAEGAHYLDHAAEAVYINGLFDALGGPAEEAGLAVVPGMSFYVATADLLADVVSAGMNSLDTLTVAYAINGWRMTPASRTTAVQLTIADRLGFTDGRFQLVSRDARTTSFDFPAPLGTRTVMADYPAGDVATIPRHVPTRSVEAYMTAETFQEDGVFTSDELDAAARAGSTFTVVVEARAGDELVTGYVRGRDIYRAGALVSVAAATRLTSVRPPVKSGVLAPAQAFDAEELLGALRDQGVFEAVSWGAGRS